MALPIEEARDRLARGFDLLSDLSPEERAALAGFLRVIESYGRLEILSLGGIVYDLPAHLGGQAQSPRAQGEELASRERNLLGQSGEAEIDLAAVLDERGIKVVTGPVNSDLGSVFTYEAAIGPSIFVNSSGGAAEARFWLAHAYAHLVADNDPYRVRVCRAGGSRLVPSEEIELEDWYDSAADLSADSIAASEERANAFAEALLMPADLLAAFVGGVRRETGRALSPDLLLQLEGYFGVNAERIAFRLSHLGALAPQAAATLAAEASSRRPAAVAAMPAEVLPRRMIDLAVGAFDQSKITLDQLAEALGTDRRGAKKLLAAYDLPGRRPPEPKG